MRTGARSAGGGGEPADPSCRGPTPERKVLEDTHTGEGYGLKGLLGPEG